MNYCFDHVKNEPILCKPEEVHEERTESAKPIDVTSSDSTKSTDSTPASSTEAEVYNNEGIK